LEAQCLSWLGWYSRSEIGAGDQIHQPGV
jgi:hypothetical protein